MARDFVPIVTAGYAPQMSLRTRSLAAVAIGGVLLGLLTPSAQAAREVSGKERSQLLRAVAASSAGEDVRLRVSRSGRVTMAPAFAPSAAKVVSVRSSVDRNWAALVATPKSNPALRTTFVLTRANGQWRVKLSAGRGDEGAAMCRVKKPSAAVAFDLGFPDTSLEDGCRHRRTFRSVTRPMTAGEVASVRSMVEWTQDPDTFEMIPGPVQPTRSDVRSVSSCSWNGGGALGLVPTGRVSRADPRWGVVYVGCVVGSDGFSLMENAVQVLVGRSAGSGAFTSVPGMVLPSRSPLSDLCLQDLKWPVSPAARADLDFCLPYPLALRNALL